MSRILKRTQNTDFLIADVGDNVPAEGQLVIEPQRLLLYMNSNDLITALSDGELVYNDGSNDLSLVDALDHLNNYSQKFPFTDTQNIPKVASYKPEGDDFTRCSHDYTDKTTWYTDSVRVTGETPTDEGSNVYKLAQANIIDLVSGKVFKEDDISGPYLVKVYDGGAELTYIDDYTVDYEAGRVTLVNAPAGAVTCDYSYCNGGMFILEPEPNKILYLEHAEVQFSKDIAMKPIIFEIWLGNPTFNPANTIESEDINYNALTDPPRNQPRFRYKKTVYKNIKDLINSANLGQGEIPAIDGLTATVVFPFNYVFIKPLKASLGAQLRIRNVNNEVFGGSFGTITFYCLSGVDT